MKSIVRKRRRPDENDVRKECCARGVYRDVEYRRPAHQRRLIQNARVFSQVVTGTAPQRDSLKNRVFELGARAQLMMKNDSFSCRVHGTSRSGRHLVTLPRRRRLRLQVKTPARLLLCFFSLPDWSVSFLSHGPSRPIFHITVRIQARDSARFHAASTVFTLGTFRFTHIHTHSTIGRMGSCLVSSPRRLINISYYVIKNAYAYFVLFIYIYFCWGLIADGSRRDAWESRSAGWNYGNEQFISLFFFFAFLRATCVGREMPWRHRVSPEWYIKRMRTVFIITRFLFLEKFFIYYVLRPKHRPFKLEILSKGICRHFKYMGRICKKKYLCYERKIVSLTPDHISHTLTNTGKTNTQVERHKRTGIACCTLLSARHWIKTSPAKSKRRVRKAALGQLEDTEKKNINLWHVCFLEREICYKHCATVTGYIREMLLHGGKVGRGGAFCWMRNFKWFIITELPVRMSTFRVLLCSLGRVNNKIESQVNKRAFALRHLFLTITKKQSEAVSNLLLWVLLIDFFEILYCPRD